MDVNLESIELPKKIIFAKEEFDWENETYYDWQDSANYVFMGVIYSDDNVGNLEKLKAFCDRHGIECEFDRSGGGYLDDDGREIGWYLDDLLENDDLLIRFIFGPKSSVQLDYY